MLVLWLTGCTTPETAPSLARYAYSSPHMGTLFQITLYAASESQAATAAQAAFDRVAQLEDVLSNYIADSELNRFTTNPVGVPVVLSADLYQVLDEAASISSATQGAFDITAGSLTHLWRFSRKRQQLPSATDLSQALGRRGWTNIVLDADAQTATLQTVGLRLDPGGIAKGYAADEALAVLETHGIRHALVAASGDIRTSLPPPGHAGWTVAVAAPAEPDLPASGQPPLILHNAAVSTSGNTEQFVEIDGVRYGHIVSPLTGLGLTNRVQATVIAPTATLSDALATACCILGPDNTDVILSSFPGVTIMFRLPDDRQIVRGQTHTEASEGSQNQFP